MSGDAGLSGDPGLHARLLAFAHELADEADQVTMAAFGQRLEADRKADGSPVTRVDMQVEERLRDRIESAWPGHAVVGEEYGSNDVDAELAWFIDPVDGTKNFMRGLPVFATLICVQHAEVPAVAVASAPALGARWDGHVGVGARRDGRAIQVSDTSDLASATVSFGGLNWFEPHGRDLVGRITRVTARQRGFGDFWHHCLVAEGAIDVALEGDVSTWDLAAVRCIVQAAGGAFTDFSGADRIDGGTAVSTTPTLIGELLPLLGT